MSKDLSRAIWIGGFLIVFSLICSLFLSGLDLLAFVNVLFMTSMCASMIGLVLFVVKGGAFDFFTYSCKKIVKLFSRDRVPFDSNFESAFALSESVDRSLMKSLLYSGLVLVFLSTVLAYSL
ncbi:DUF3899 domain-containing protein [Fictibacillus aquaticus]|nr:DUF3899 domain-containing protein [Fictibacillus aquaticus]